MKTKKIQKKLALNKQTIATLGREEMSDVKAGCFTPFTPFTPIISIILHCEQTNRCPNKAPTEYCGI